VLDGNVPFPANHQTYHDVTDNRSWEKGCDMDQLRATDPGLAIAASVPVHRLGSKEEVASVVTMYVESGQIVQRN
jgi:hypothetical protein